MALSPLAAMAMPLAVDPAWRESAAGFGERLRAHMQDTVFSDGFQQKWQQVSGFSRRTVSGVCWLQQQYLRPRLCPTVFSSLKRYNACL